MDLSFVPATLRKRFFEIVDTPYFDTEEEALISAIRNFVFEYQKLIEESEKYVK